MPKNVPIENIRHSLSHLMSMAIMEKYPKTGLGVGPAIENGFYQDYDLPGIISEKDFGWMEKRIRELIAQKIKFVKSESDFASALKFYEHDPYKTEIINDLKTAGEKNLSFYDSDWFHNLCLGPHVKDTSEINPEAFKLDKVAGAYWRGSEKNKMLTRIYGLAFTTKKELTDYLELLKEAEKRDHKKIGKEMGLFSFHDEAPGFPFWHNKGMVLREALMRPYNEMIKKAGYKIVSTPILLPEDLWRQSGHWDNYKDQMYFTEIEKKNFAIKPMNCPGTIIIYKNCPRSYRELPLRLAEFGEIHRHEPSGTLNGLFRTRAFRQDDSHIFLREDQTEREVKDIIKLTLKFYKIIGFKEINIELSTRPKKSIGTDEMWNKAENVLKKILNGLKLKFKINEGDGAFYGPKIDFHIKDCLGRSWQCATIQLDFSMPERFGLEYIDEDGLPKRPVMIHRTVLGSIQRFVGILIEHFGGAFPFWLSPEQIWVIPITDKHIKYAKKVGEELASAGLRVEIKEENQTVGKKIREGELQKIPYLLIVGDKEMKTKSVAVRQKGKGDIGMIKLSKFLERVKIEKDV